MRKTKEKLNAEEAEDTEDAEGKWRIKYIKDAVGRNLLYL